MTPKLMSFLCWVWFGSTLICLILEGTYFGSTDNTIINDLSVMTVMKIGGLVPIPAPNIYFFRGVVRILLWDYSFYTGSWQILRYLWLVTLSPGAVWGIGSVFASVFANFLRLG